MSNKVFGIIIGIIAIAVIGVAVVMSGDTNPTNNQTDDVANLHSINERDYVKGQAGEPLAEEPLVTVIEYGDFQCPACGAVYPAVKQALEQYADDDRVQFVFRHFPLTAIHPNAMATHRAAEAAGKQNQFYAMHDLLYENQFEWSQSDDINGLIRGYAEQLELDIDQFLNDFSDSETLKTINAQLETGEQLGVTGTPTFFINGQQLDQNPRTPDELITAIEAELATAQE